MCSFLWGKDKIMCSFLRCSRLEPSYHGPWSVALEPSR